LPTIRTADGVTLCAAEWGEGPPVVFTHAWALRGDQWTYQVPALVEAGLRCVTYDRRGHGRSDRVGFGYDLDTLAGDLSSVLEQLDLHGVTLIGHSLGCKEIVRYLTRHGQGRVARVVLVAPTTPFLRRTADNPDGWDPELIDANLAALRADVPKWCRDFERRGPYFGSSAGGSAGLVDWTIDLIVDTPLYVLLETMKANAHGDMRSELAALSLPALIVHGDADASAPLALTGERTAALMPGARLIVYRGAGHGLYASDHERLNRDILTFLGAG
jgi:non-heme chloroperoxidase